jgi:hypothetical protein
MALPDGWTDDMNVTIRADRTAPELVSAVMGLVQNFHGGSEMVEQIAREFGMSDEDARLAFDRVQGGIIRALTARWDNCPSPDKDPLAWLSFHETWQTLPKRDQATDERVSGGPWLTWFNAVRELRNRGTSNAD